MPRTTAGRALAALVTTTVLGAACMSAAPAQPITPVEPPDVRVLAAGDIGVCSGKGDEATAALLAERPDASILVLGDLAYDNGTTDEFATCFGESWGAHRARMYPAPGNHDYRQPGAAPYYAYFGARAGPSGLGYYSFDLGEWHLIALNSESDINEGGEQLKWLHADLALNARHCVLAFWHKPRFTRAEYDDDLAMQPFWSALAGAGAELVLSGHDHDYQRYKPLNVDGEPADDGTRQFVVGTGGARLYKVRQDPRRDVASDHAWGVLELTLRSAGYDWRFVPVAGERFTDSGSAACR